MSKLEVSPLYLLKLIKKSIEMDKIDNALGILDDAIKQLEELEKEEQENG